MDEVPNKSVVTEISESNTINNPQKRISECNNNQLGDANKRQKLEETPAAADTMHPHTSRHVHQSPKKRLDLVASKKEKGRKFIYGNYSLYYGYRNMNKDHHDIRLDMFEGHRELFLGREVLDIGCNSGHITMEVAKKFAVKSITGIDIDRNLIKQAQRMLTKQKDSTAEATDKRLKKLFPFNVSFLQANYVLKDDVLLEIEEAQFDVLLCLSITKWIHLNFGDAGLKQAFRRMFLQLRSGGKLILEAQPFDNYKRRKKITPEIFANYQAIKFFPKDFTAYLLSPDVGFKSMEMMGVPEHCVAGFKRPIQIFLKE